MTSDFARQSYGSSGRLRPGSRIAGYLIEEQIGAGGMGAVFRARDEMLGRLAAVKIVAPSTADDEEFRARFLRESRIAAAVDSPYIIPVYGAGEVGGLLYIATRFVPGGDLERLRQRSGGAIAPERVSALLAQVASALDTAHAAGLVHRDVKPHNILVDSVPEQPDHAFLSDFGISKGTGFATGLTATGQFVGTPGFCAPEQITSTSVDGRADQYALACVAFVLLTGELPFRRRDTMAMLYAHVHDPVPSLSGRCPGLPPAVDGVVARALAKSPADRYSRCGEFAAALAEALILDPAAVAPGRRNRLARTAGKPAGEMSPGSASTAAGRGHGASTPGRGRRHQRGKARAIWAAGAGAVLAAGVVAAALLHVSFPGLGRAGAVPSQPPASRVPSLPAGPASPGPRTGDVAASRVLAKGSYGFKDLTGITADGTHIWVASYGGNSVTELNAADGTWVATLAGGNYGFNHPTSVSADGTHIWVANAGGNSVTELNAADGTWVATLAGGSYGFNDPTSVSADGTHIWVANAGGNSVTELSAADGTWVATLSGGKYGFDDPYDIAVGGTHIWVGNYDGNSVTELNAADGTWVATLAGGNYGFSGPYDIAVSGTRIWVANNTGRSVTELNAADGTWVATLSGGNYGFNYPTAVAAHGNRVWVTDNTGQAVTELDAADGTWVQTLSGGSYGFSHPYGIAAERNHVWVANNTGQSVTELTVS